MKIQSKLPDVGTTIFSIMTNLSNEHNAVNLSQGFPDFDVPDELIALVEKYMHLGYNQYAPMQGVPLLCERISQKTKELYNATYTPTSEITITSGATEALFAAISCTVSRGDEVIIIEPAYDSYVPAILLNGGIPIYVKMDYPGYKIDWNKLKDAVSQKTKLIIINSPHNPSGAIFSHDDIKSLIDIIKNSNIMILSDEVYEHIIFDKQVHESMAKYPDLARRSFVISSFGKTYHATGWKIGYCMAPVELTKEFRKIHQFITYASNTPIQHAYADFMQNKDIYLSLCGFYQKKRDLFLTLIKDSKFKAESCNGTYFQMLDYSEISDEPDFEFSRRLTVENGIASIPPSVFYHDKQDNKVLRFCFAKKDETLKKAAEKLCQM